MTLLHHRLMLCDVVWSNICSSRSGIMSNPTATAVSPHSATISPRGHYLHFMTGWNFTRNVSSRRCRRSSSCSHILRDSMWHVAMHVHVGCQIANVNIPRNMRWKDLHRVHGIPGRTPGHVTCRNRLRLIHLLMGRSNNGLLFARSSTNVHRYIVAIWRRISRLHLL